MAWHFHAPLSSDFVINCAQNNQQQSYKDVIATALDASENGDSVAVDLDAVDKPNTDDSVAVDLDEVDKTVAGEEASANADKAI